MREAEHRLVDVALSSLSSTSSPPLSPTPSPGIRFVSIVTDPDAQMNVNDPAIVPDPHASKRPIPGMKAAPPPAVPQGDIPGTGASMTGTKQPRQDRVCCGQGMDEDKGHGEGPRQEPGNREEKEPLEHVSDAGGAMKGAEEINTKGTGVENMSTETKSAIGEVAAESEVASVPGSADKVCARGEERNISKERCARVGGCLLLSQMSAHFGCAARVSMP